MKYEDILTAKNSCYEIIKKNLGQKFFDIFKYYKGDLLPFINTKIRKDMTCGDIDCIQWDYNKKILRIIEGKRSREQNKNSQDKLLKFLSSIVIPEYKVSIYKAIGDPPYNNVKVFNIKTGIIKQFNQEEFIKFLEMT